MFTHPLPRSIHCHCAGGGNRGAPTTTRATPFTHFDNRASPGKRRGQRGLRYDGSVSLSGCTPRRLSASFRLSSVTLSSPPLGSFSCCYPGGPWPAPVSLSSLSRSLALSFVAAEQTGGARGRRRLIQSAELQAAGTTNGVKPAQ